MDTKKILIVDDEMDVLSVLGERLGGEGYTVITAESGNDALVLARSKNPDLIILDRALGDMLGEEVAQRLKENPSTRSIPIIYISALFSAKDEIEKEHVFGGNVMFAKPYDTNKLLAEIKKIV